MSVAYAEFKVRVHASNRNAEYGTPVTVIASSRKEAVQRAIDIGWNGYERDARVTVDSIRDLDPRECSCSARLTEAREP